MKNAKWNRRNQITAAAVSLLLSFTGLFFPAAESFFLNPVDFSIPAQQAIFPLLLTVLGIAAGIWLLLNLCLLMHEKLFQFLVSLLFGISLAFYIQMLCYNGRMTQLDGVKRQSRSEQYLMVNWIVMLGITMLPAMIFLLKQVKPVIRFTTYFRQKMIPMAAGVIAVMQLAGLTSAIVKYQYNGLAESSAARYYFSYEKTTSLSGKHNIVIFLVDRMDGTFIDDLMLQYPDFADSLKGFTAYRNNTSCYPVTFPSVPEMLSGIQYEGESWLDYTRKIWAGNDNVLQQIHSAGYQVNLIGDTSALFNNPKQALSCVDNLKPAAAGTDFYYNYSGKTGILRTEIRYSLYRALPYYLKSICFPLTVENFTIMTESANDCHPLTLTSDSDLKYYSYLQEHALHADSNKNTFNFVHFFGAHGTDAKIMEMAGGSDSPAEGIVNDFEDVQEVRGDFTIIGHYLDQMKQLGIYDCSDIIILGDHGQQTLDMNSLTQDGKLKTEIRTGLTTALMMKPAYAPHEKMNIDRKTEMSNAYLSASILEYTGLDHSAYGCSYSEAAAGMPHADRIFSVLGFAGYGTPRHDYTFSVSGDANDFSNWTCLEGPEEYVSHTP